MLLTVGDLVQVRDPDDEVIGLVLEMRDMIHRRPEARVMWSDLPQARWIPVDDLWRVEEKGK